MNALISPKVTFYVITLNLPEPTGPMLGGRAAAIFDTNAFEAQTIMSSTSSISRQALVSICGILAICGFDTCHQSRAAEPFKLFGVAVYLDRDPPCTTASVNSVTITVSPFKEQVYLGDIVTELARKAAEARADVVYAIKLTSFIPNQGAVATATISTCRQPNLFPLDSPPPLDAELAELVKRAPDVRAYLFTERIPDPQRSVQTSALLQTSFNGSEAAARLRRLIFADDTYRSTPGVKIDPSCPFVPNFGFEFRDGNNSAWWLVSETCETAMLVSPEAHWPGPGIRNLKPESITAFRQLLGSPK
jgi:hypothetical protein